MRSRSTRVLAGLILQAMIIGIVPMILGAQRLDRPGDLFPHRFVRNNGIWQSSVLYRLHHPSGVVDVTPDGLRLYVEKGDHGVMLGWSVRGGAEVDYEGDSESESSGVTGRIGPDGYTATSSYDRLSGKDILSGVDLHLGVTDQGDPKYELRLDPGVDPSSILLDYAGQTDLCIEPDGRLRIGTPLGPVWEEPPIAWQMTDRGARPLAIRFHLEEDGGLGFRVGEWDRRYPVVIDPAIRLSSYLGGDGNDVGRGVVTDRTGDLFVTGSSFSRDFPTTPGAYDRSRDTIGGTRDIFVARFDRTGRNLLWSTWISGDGNDDPIAGIRTTDDGGLLVAGVTTSTDFPQTTNVVGTAPFGGVDGFVLKLDTNGRRLIWSTYVGGSRDDSLVSFDIDIQKNIILAGHSRSTDFTFPAGLLRTAEDSTQNIFAFRLRGDASEIINGSWVGGSGADRATDVVVGPGGECYLSGTTSSANFPTTPNAVSSLPMGGTDGVVLSFQFDFTALPWSTRIGGGGDDIPEAIARDGSGNVLITGFTSSDNYPDNVNIADSGSWFVTLFRGSDRGIVYSLFLSGDTLSRGLFATFDNVGRPILVGQTASSRFPTTANPKRTGPGGGLDLAIVRLASNGQLLDRAAVIGGALDDQPAKHLWWPSVAGELFMTGVTRSRDFPLSRYPFDSQINVEPAASASDAFVLVWSVDERPNLVGPRLFQIDTLRCQPAVRDTFWVHNDGERPATIYASLLERGDGPFELIEPGDLTNIVVTPGDSVRYIVEYRNEGVGTDTNRVLVYSTDSIGGRSPLAVPVIGLRSAPSIVGLPSTLEFGRVATCGEKSLDLQITNNGRGGGTVRSPLFLGSSGAFRVGPGTTFPLSIPQGGSRTVKIVFDPDQAIPYDDIIRFTINECSFSILEVPLHGNGEKAELEGIPDTLDFGTLPPCVTSADTSFSITNRGAVNLTINQSGAGPADFEIISPQLPDTISPGESREVTLRFRPLGAGDKSGDIALLAGPCDTLLNLHLRGAQNDAGLPFASRVEIDYGTIYSCSSGSSLADSVLRIVNPGTEVVLLSEPVLTGPFILCGLGSPPTQVSPSSSAPFHICFRPPGEGAFSGEFLVEYRSGECRDTIRVKLQGSLERPMLETDSEEIDLGIIEACGETAIEVEIPFTNPTGATLTIDGVDPDPNLDLSGLSLPITLDPGETRPLVLGVDLKTGGQFSIPVRVHTGPCGDEILVTLLGETTGVVIGADRDSMRIGPVLACSPANLISDTVNLSWSGSTVDPVTITSIRLREGGGAISIEDEGSLQGRVIPEGGLLPIGILFSASDIGPQTDTLEVVLAPCGDTILIPVYASAVFPTLSVSSGAFGQVVTGNSLTKVIAIGNNSGVPLELDLVRFASEPYSIDTNGLNLPLLLEPDDVILIPVTFAPKLRGQATDSMAVTLSGGCEYRRSIRFDGEGIDPVTPAELCIRGLYLEPGRSGDTAEISIGSDPQVTLAAPVELELVLSFDPARVDVADVIDGDLYEVDLVNGRAVIQVYDVLNIPADLPRIRLRLLAGEDLYTLVGLDSVRVIGGSSFAPTICDTSAVVTITNSCIVSGITLGSFPGKLEPITPNPAGNSISLTFQQLEDAPTRLTILDATGREVLRPIDGPMRGGRYTVQVDLSSLPAGLYVVALQAGTWRGSEMFIRHE